MGFCVLTHLAWQPFQSLWILWRSPLLYPLFLGLVEQNSSSSMKRETHSNVMGFTQKWTYDCDLIPDNKSWTGHFSMGGGGSIQTLFSLEFLNWEYINLQLPGAICAHIGKDWQRTKPNMEEIWAKRQAREIISKDPQYPSIQPCLNMLWPRIFQSYKLVMVGFLYLSTSPKQQIF